jgi:TRAP-type transport system small permease protein
MADPTPLDPLADPAAELESEDADAFSPPEDGVSRAGRLLCEAMVVCLVVMMGVEMVARSIFGWSIQWSNEIGGYALVAITFLSLGSGQLLHAYHRVHFVEHRLAPSGRAALRLFFDVAALLVALVLLAELVRFEWITWRSGDVAATTLMTPLWLPRLAMPLGTLLLVLALSRTVVADLRRWRAAGRPGPAAQGARRG